jgi:hypothetical protein
VDIYYLLYLFYNSPGPGGVIVLLVYGGACVIYYLLTRWILAGSAQSPQGTDAPKA